MPSARGPLAEPLPWNLVSKDYAIELVPQAPSLAALIAALAEQLSGRPQAALMPALLGIGRA
jgi:hypothetical protein